MEQKTVSQYAPIKYAFSTFFANILLYLQLFALVAAGVIIATLLKNYLVTTEFIPAGRLDQLSYLAFVYFFKFCYWGACLVVATKLLQTCQATIIDFILSTLYFPQFVIVQAVFFVPYGLGFYLMTRGSAYGPFDYPVSAFMPIVLIPLMVLGLLWIVYGQLAIPILVMEKQDIWASIAASVRDFNRERWYVLELLVYYGLIGFGLIVLFGALASLAGVSDINAVLNGIGSVITCLLYALTALSYVYLYDWARRKQHSLP